MKIQFDTGMVTADAHKEMAKEARRVSEAYRDKSAGHYTAWLKLAEALDGAEDIALANPGEPETPGLKTKLLR